MSDFDDTCLTCDNSMTLKGTTDDGAKVYKCQSCNTYKKIGNQ